MTDTAARKDKPRMGRPPATSREEIAQAALGLASQEGLEAVTIRRLADAMGRAPMTLYNYARTKDEIVDLMVAVGIESFVFEPDRDEPWRDQMQAGLMRLYETFRAHPVIVELLVAPRAMTGPALDTVRERLLSVMARSGMPRQRAVDIFNTLGAYLIGVAAVEIGRARRADELRTHLETLPEGQFPEVAGSPGVWAHAIPPEMVENGLRHLLNGLTADT